MAAIRLQNVSKTFPAAGSASFHALSGISCEFAEGEVVTIVGPSGCGKSTLLRILAGLEEPTSGMVEIAGRPVNGIPARERNIAMVFQSYALYPHMTCYENLALNLELKKVPPDQVRQRVEEMARKLEIEEILNKKPKQLSGGQRQRVAVGRALIRDPQAFLLDEPLSNLDAALRERVRHELKELFRSLKASVVYVTHDQIEAMTLADRIVILDRGRVQQIGTPEEVYRHPANRFVASFIGSPSMNFFDAELLRGTFLLNDVEVDTGTGFTGPATVGIRPDEIALKGGDITAHIQWIEHLGAHYLVGVDCGGVRLALTTRQHPQGSFLQLHVQLEHIHLFKKEARETAHGENLRSRPAAHANRL